MIDLQLQALLKQAAEQGTPDFADLPPAECRQFFRDFLAMVDAPPPDSVTFEDRTIPGPGGDLPIRVYRPKNADGSCPVLLYLHGGGWVLGGLDEYHGVCSNLSAKTGCAVVAVDYRLAPEHRFPAAIDDCYAALEWIAANASEIGADASRIAVAGDSAGGTMASVLTLMARDQGGPEIKLQVLVYPGASPRSSGYPSYEQYGEGYLLTTRSMRWFREHYLGREEPFDDFRAAPLLADNLGGLPPALVLIGTYDPLRDEGIDYAEKMLAAGTQVVVTEYTGMMHGFFSMSGVLDAAKQAMDQVAGAVRDALGSKPA